MTLECLMIATTLGTSTATVERSFSSLCRLKPYLRTTISQQRLDDLAILYIKEDLSSRLWSSINDLVIKFAQVHNNSKIVLLWLCFVLFFVNFTEPTAPTCNGNNYNNKH